MVRKISGYDHIPKYWASQINDFNWQHLKPYLNYHRCCLFPEIITDKKGRQRKRYTYDLLMTLYEKFKSLPDAKQYLKPGLTFEILDAIAYRQGDNEAADKLQQARQQLFKSIHDRETNGA